MQLYFPRQTQLYYIPKCTVFQDKHINSVTSTSIHPKMVRFSSERELHVNAANGSGYNSSWIIRS
ncbi:hypothetical protein DAI22_07g242900 [Oryza sativa Japonica Group]|nr:hypothetical protein DAI22_07g242900 [Oryza sativa Japonica Group]